MNAVVYDDKGGYVEGLSLLEADGLVEMVMDGFGPADRRGYELTETGVALLLAAGVAQHELEEGGGLLMIARRAVEKGFVESIEDALIHTVKQWRRMKR